MKKTNIFYKVYATNYFGNTAFEAFYLERDYAQYVYDGLCKCEDVNFVMMTDDTTGEVIAYK